jgi:hypothetical protein
MEKKSSFLRAFVIFGLVLLCMIGVVAVIINGTLVRPVLRPADEDYFRQQDAYKERTIDGPGGSYQFLKEHIDAVYPADTETNEISKLLRDAQLTLEGPLLDYTLRNGGDAGPPSVGEVTSSTLYILWRYQLMDVPFTFDPIYQDLLSKQSSIDPAMTYDPEGLRILIKDGHYLYSEQNVQDTHRSNSQRSRIRPLAMSTARIGEAHIEAAEQATEDKPEERYRPEHYSIPTPADFKPFDEEVDIKPIVDNLDERLKNSPLNSETLSDLIILFEIENMDDAFARVVDADLYDAESYLPLATDAFNLAPLGEGHFLLKHYITAFHPAPMRWVVDVAYGKPVSMDMPLEDGAQLVFGDGTSFTLPCDPVRSGERKPWQTEDSKEYTDEGLHGVHVLQIADMAPSWQTPFFQAQFLDKDHQPVGSVQNMRYPRSILTCRTAESRAEYLRIYRFRRLHQYIISLGELPGTPRKNDGIEDLMRVKIPYPYAHIFSAGTLIDNLTGLKISIFKSDLNRPWPPENNKATSVLDIAIRFGKDFWGKEVDVWVEDETLWVNPRKSIPEKLKTWYEKFKMTHSWTFLP